MMNSINPIFLNQMIINDTFPIFDHGGQFPVNPTGGGNNLQYGNCLSFLGGENIYSTVPPLESASMEENNQYESSGNGKNIYSSCNNVNRTNACNFNSNNDNDNSTVAAAGVGNFWQGDDLKVGEWDLEELMKDVSSFPFLDFSS